MAMGSMGSWFNEILTPAAPTPEPTPKTEPAKESKLESQPVPNSIQVKAPWKRLLRNAKHLFPEMYQPFMKLYKSGVTIIQANNQFYFARGAFLTGEQFEELVSSLYFQVILWKVKDTKMYEVFDRIWTRGAVLKETESSLKLTKGPNISEIEWEAIKEQLLQPNREQIINLQREARRDVTFALIISRMAEYSPFDDGVEWENLGAEV